MDHEKQELKEQIKDYIKEEHKENFYKLIYEELDYKATDINEDIKILTTGQLETKIEEELLEDLIKQVDEIKETITTYRKVRHLFN